MSFLALFTQEKDGKFSVTVPALPGCFSEGDNFEEAKKNIEEAITLYLEGEEVDNPSLMQFVASVDVKK